MIWDRKRFKRDGKKAFLKNYVTAVFVTFLIAFMVGESSDCITIIMKYDNTKAQLNNVVNTAKKYSDFDELRSVIRDFKNGVWFNSDDELEEEKYQFDINENASTDEKVRREGKLFSAAYFDSVIETVASENTLLLRLYKANKEFIVNHRVITGIGICIGAIILYMYYIFVGNLLTVGKRRYFLENRMEKDQKTPFQVIIHSFRSNYRFNVVKVMFFKSLYTFLWSFTIVGVIIKGYQYRVIPYILAENSGIDVKDAFALSKSMTNGYKWEWFKMDMSFILWNILNRCTFGVAGLFFVSPYMYAADAEAYIALRNEAIELNKQYWEHLCNPLFNEKDDAFAGTTSELSINDIQLYHEHKIKYPKLHTDYNRTYSISTLIIMGITFAVGGWCWEVILHIVQTGEFVNRGVLNGPWLPIYGFGAVGVLIFLRRWFNNPVKTFILTMILASIIEYATSWYLEIVNGVRWWDYTGYFMNVNGRICLEGAVVFGVAGCATVYLLGPLIAGSIDRIPKKIKIVLCVVLLSAFIGDFVYSHFYPNMGKGITTEEYKKLKMMDENRT